MFTNDRFNESNSAIFLNNGYLKLPTDFYFSGDFSIMLWLNLISNESNFNLIYFSNQNSDTVSLKFSHDKIRIYVYQKYQHRYIETVSLDLKTWYHLAFVLNETKGSLYLNGIKVSQRKLLLPPYNVLRSDNYIGDKETQGVFLLDGLKIYQGALSFNQIIDSFKSGTKVFIIEIFVKIFKNINFKESKGLQTSAIKPGL